MSDLFQNGITRYIEMAQADPITFGLDRTLPDWDHWLLRWAAQQPPYSDGRRKGRRRLGGRFKRGPKLPPYFPSTPEPTG